MAGETRSEDEEFAALVRQQTLDAFGLKAWQVGLGPAPWHARPGRAFRRLRWWLRLRKGGSS